MQMVVKVLPDIRGIDHEFDYTVPEVLESTIEIGLEVLVPFRNRKVRGWVTAIHHGHGDLAENLELKSIIRARSKGPPPEVIELARWVAWRWNGRWSGILATASSPRIVDPHRVRVPAHDLMAGLVGNQPGKAQPAGSGNTVRHCLDQPYGHQFHRGQEDPVRPGPVIVQLPPAVDSTLWVAGQLRQRYSVAGKDIAFQESGANPGALVLCPTHLEAQYTADVLGRFGFPVVLLPDGWDMAREGGCIAVGTRQAVFAPLPALQGIFVLSAHDSLYKGERTPSWSAWQVAAERSRRAGVPCWLITPWPTLALLEQCPTVYSPMTHERYGWPSIAVVDLAKEDPYEVILGDEVKHAIRWVLGSPDRIGILVLNRFSKIKLTICNACRKVPRCTRCNHALDYLPRSHGENAETVAVAAPSGSSDLAAGANQTAGSRLSSNWQEDSRRGPGTGAGGSIESGGSSESSELCLSCARCGSIFDARCPYCGNHRFRQEESKISRIKQKLEKYFAAPVGEVLRSTNRASGTGKENSGGKGDGTGIEGTGIHATGQAPEAPARPVQLYLGTEAVLYRHTRANVVIFLDIDLDLLAPRLDAAENAIAMLVRAAWITRDSGYALRVHDAASSSAEPGSTKPSSADGHDDDTVAYGHNGTVTSGKTSGDEPSRHNPSRYNGGLVIQTRVPDHPVIKAVLAGDPDIFTSTESAIRRKLSLPPYSAVARLSGPGAQAYAHMVERTAGKDATGSAICVNELPGGAWVVSAGNGRADHKALCDLLAATKRPAQRVRVEVDPPSL